MSCEKLPDPMGSTRNDFTNAEALSKFAEGVAAKIGSNYGEVTTLEERREVKKGIARELGVGEKYVHNVFAAANEDLKEGKHERLDARRLVEERYTELRKEGRVQESPSLAEREPLFVRVNREIVAGP